MGNERGQEGEQTDRPRQEVHGPSGCGWVWIILLTLLAAGDIYAIFSGIRWLALTLSITWVVVILGCLVRIALESWSDRLEKARWHRSPNNDGHDSVPESDRGPK